MKKKRIIIVGKGGSGKDHLRKILEKIGFSYCISHTSRPPRENEQEGKDYYFINTSGLERMVEDFYEHTWFNGWFYGTSFAEFSRANLFIMTPKGVSSLRPEDREESLIVHIDISEDIRRERLSQRRDADDVERRIQADYNDFKDFTDYDVVIDNPEFSLSDLTDKVEITPEGFVYLYK